MIDKYYTISSFDDSNIMLNIKLCKTSQEYKPVATPWDVYHLEISKYVFLCKLYFYFCKLMIFLENVLL